MMSVKQTVGQALQIKAFQRLIRYIASYLRFCSLCLRTLAAVCLRLASAAHLSKHVNFSIYGGNLPMVKNENKNFAYTTHRIGGTTYKVKVVFNDSGTETMEDNSISASNCFHAGRLKLPPLHPSSV